MPRNSGGTYSLPSGNPVVAGTTIEAAWANNTLSDVGNELTNSLSRQGTGGMLAALRLADGSVTVPGLAFVSETTTGFYRAASNDMRMAILGSDVWAATSSAFTISKAVTLSVASNLGTPSAVTLTNATGLPIATGVSGLGTGVATALAVNTGSSGAFVVNGGALGTPSSGTVTNLTGTASININGTVGATTPNTGSFTTLSASSTVSGAGFSNYLASPPAIGGTAAAAGSFTTLSASGAVTLSGGTANGVLYLNGSKVATSGSGLTWNGTNFGIGIAVGAAKLDVTGPANSLQARFGNIAGRGLELSTTSVNGTNDAGVVLNACGAGDGTLIIQLDSSEKARFTGSDFLLGGTSTGAAGIGLNNLLNYSVAEGSGASYLNLFRQTSSGATVLANGYKRSATANGFASSVGTLWAKSAVVLNNGDVVVYADAAATVANGTDATPTERFRVKSTGQSRFVPLAADPSGAENGDVYYNSTTNKLRVRAGGAWVDLH